MNVAQSAEILASTILTSLTFIVVIVCILFINNLISKYWKPVKLWIFEPAPTPRFIDETVTEHKDIK
jgi:hypothetical protein